MVDEITTLALQKLQDPNLLGWVEKVLDEDAGIVREKRNKLYLFLLLLSGHSKMPKIQQMVQIRANSRAGKSWLATQVSMFFKTKDLGSISKEVVKYIDFTNFEVFYMQELLDVDKEHSEIRLMAAEDGGFKYAVTVPKADGKGFEVKEGKVPPMAFLTTTTRFDVDEQFVNRMHILNVDETEKQTIEIFNRYQTKDKVEILEWLGKTKPSKNIDILKRVVQLLDPEVYASPTSVGIIKHVFPAFNSLRIRSDYHKISTLIRMIVYLYQYQRPYIYAEDNKGGSRKIVLGLPQDVYYALELIKEPIVAMVTGLEKRQRTVLPALAEMVDHKTIIKGVEITGFIPQDVKPYLGGTVRGVKYQLDSLANEGYLEKHTIQGETLYRVAINKDDLDKLVNMQTAVKSTTQLAEKIKTEAVGQFKFIEDNIGVKFNLPEDAFSIMPIPEWFDDDYKGNLKLVDSKPYSIQVKTKFFTNVEHLLAEESKIYHEASRQWFAKYGQKLPEDIVGITTVSTSEIYSDKLAKWLYHLIKIKFKYLEAVEEIPISQEQLINTLRADLVLGSIRATLHEMLHNPKYVGKLKTGKYSFGTSKEDERTIDEIVKALIMGAVD